MTSFVADLKSRAVISLTGEGWRDFLQGLITQDVDTLAPGELRFGALLTPQGRLLFDLFVSGDDAGALVDCEAALRATLIQRLTMYRLRAKVEIAPSDLPVQALFGTDDEAAGWLRDPRLPGLGRRGYGAAAPAGASAVEEATYDAHRLVLGVPGPLDWGSDRTYPIEANFDLLNGIDFRKGCFVGQETTSRMKRRGQIKSRMAPIAFDGPPPAPGAELLAGELRAGEVLSGAEGRAMAVLRLDRVGPGLLTLADGRAVRAELPVWLDG
ncbi:MAG TPA: folate-binding protein YgfZ [Caulobacteraceae bacterium]|jgi:hypothetical protein|nr:folate-binding protein YgfZ [Caulobacteraceae bacterium]